MKVGDVIEYATRYSTVQVAQVISVVHEQRNKYGEHCVTMWVQRLRGRRKERPIPMTLASKGDSMRIVGEGKVMAING